jgi:hypothetical protein
MNFEVISFTFLKLKIAVNLFQIQMNGHSPVSVIHLILPAKVSLITSKFDIDTVLNVRKVHSQGSPIIHLKTGFSPRSSSIHRETTVPALFPGNAGVL